MYYRRKILLSLIEFCGKNLSNTRFEKLLFLYSKKHNNYYDFFPFKYGCFSLQSYQDKRILIKKGFLEDSENNFILKQNISFIDKIKNEDRKNLMDFSSKHKKLTNQQLIRKTYLEYPFYASKSIILDDVLDGDEKNMILNNRKLNQKTMFTIGYEGKTIDKYLQILIQNRINTIIDVRKNPYSMKFNFAKKKFSEHLKRVDVDYIHIPELGIESNRRAKLETEEDYKNLFDHYQKNNFLNHVNILKNLYDILNNKERIALTCFERDFNYCHRHIISDYFEAYYKVIVKHL